MTPEDKINDDAETIQEGFDFLVKVGYENNLNPNSPEYNEARKVFFCGTAFAIDRLARWVKSGNLEKFNDLIKELNEFKTIHASEDVNDIMKSIEEAWKYASPDKD